MKEKIKKQIEKNRDEIIKLSCDFVSINSVNPRADGPGEKEVAQWLNSEIEKWKFDSIEFINAPDDIVECGYRPNIIARYNGSNPERTVWFITHMDKVPAGDLSLWETDPFKAVIKEGKIYGRGSEDNGSSLVATLSGIKALMDINLRPKNNIAIALVSDEETGSQWGISYLLKQNIFGKNDWFYVPDSGNPEGSFIEIAEKSIIWLKVITTGKQAHASMPDFAKNATRYGMKFNILLDEFFHKNYADKDKLFDPDYSTFEPTKKILNVENINTIPGVDVQFFDARILPKYDIEKIIEDINKLAAEFSKENGIDVKIEIVQKESAPEPTDKEHDSVKLLKRTVESLRGIETKVGGIGGGTCAAILRHEGYPAVVWGTMDETAHQPNENIAIDYLLKDSEVYANLISEL
ncbi:MAG TPA: M20 family metallo-hydrolase [Tepiditoga sp.]|nr:M20 family metallo-hydrolase [Thermotogota bacterium]HOO74001.1 M20 family metallo-hydrolase [Tepiditoga sp.]